MLCSKIADSNKQRSMVVCFYKLLTMILVASLCGWGSCKDPREYMVHVVKQPDGYLDPMWKNPELRKNIQVNYDRFSNSDGLITNSDEHTAGMRALLLDGSQLDQLYIDAAHGNVRAQNCIKTIEATVACAGVAVAEEVFSLQCSIVSLPSCIPTWANGDVVLGPMSTSSLSQKQLRRIIAQNYENRAKDLKIENEIIGAGVQLFFTAWMLKDLRAAVLAAEAQASQRALLSTEARVLVPKATAEELRAGVAVSKAAAMATASIAEQEAVTLARQLIGKGDRLAQAVRWIKPEAGFYDVVIHGSPNAFWVLQNGSWVSISHRSLANFLKNSGYVGGPIRLISCSTGVEATGVAKDLANKLGTTVSAPTDLIHIYPDGRLVIGPNAMTNVGTWRVFTPGKP